MAPAANPHLARSNNMKKINQKRNLVGGRRVEKAKAASCDQMLLALIALLGLAGLASGCAGASALSAASLIGSPNASALEIHNNTDVRLQEKNFVVIRTNVMGESSGFSLLGVLTIVPARFSKAMSRLYAQAEMQPGRPQTLVNLVMEKDATYFILFSLPRTAIRADVIEFIPATDMDLERRPPHGEGGYKGE
jgi:hypothetical protein